MLYQLLANIRSWLQEHAVLNETVFLSVFGAAVVVLLISHIIKPPRT